MATFDKKLDFSTPEGRMGLYKDWENKISIDVKSSLLRRKLWDRGKLGLGELPRYKIETDEFGVFIYNRYGFQQFLGVEEYLLSSFEISCRLEINVDLLRNFEIIYNRLKNNIINQENGLFMKFLNELPCERIECDEKNLEDVLWSIHSLRSNKIIHFLLPDNICEKTKNIFTDAFYFTDVSKYDNKLGKSFYILPDIFGSVIDRVSWNILGSDDIREKKVGCVAYEEIAIEMHNISEIKRIDLV